MKLEDLIIRSKIAESDALDRLEVLRSKRTAVEPKGTKLPPKFVETWLRYESREND